MISLSVRLTSVKCFFCGYGFLDFHDTQVLCSGKTCYFLKMYMTTKKIFQSVVCDKRPQKTYFFCRGWQKKIFLFGGWQKKIPLHIWPQRTYFFCHPPQKKILFWYTIKKRSLIENIIFLWHPTKKIFWTFQCTQRNDFEVFNAHKEKISIRWGLQRTDLYGMTLNIWINFLKVVPTNNIFLLFLVTLIYYIHVLEPTHITHTSAYFMWC